MKLEKAKEFLELVIKDGSLRARLAGKEPDEAAAIAKELGFDVAAEDLLQAGNELRRQSPDCETPEVLSPDDLDTVAGGALWDGEDAPDGHEMGCIMSYHGYDWSRSTGNWCKKEYFCVAARYGEACNPLFKSSF